jgi:hypothetical protein
LVSEIKPAGNYKLVFNTKNLSEKSVLSGAIYSYQSSTASGLSKAKLMLLSKSANFPIPSQA